MSIPYRLVFFDVDSTLVTIEGIDILGRGDSEIVRLTEAAMNGEIPLEDVYARRLEIIRPSRAEVDALAQRYLASIVEGALEVIGELQRAGTIVHLVTAGIEQAILPLAEALDVRNVHAVRLRFAAGGAYEDFDRRSPLTRAGGKEVVVRDVRARTKGKAAFVGDGASDLEAKGAVDMFVGFGGVRERAVVRENADAYAMTMPEVAAQLL
ncbi:MAG: HAD-IB family phosphatase [Acidobacteriota bacterium]